MQHTSEYTVLDPQLNADLARIHADWMALTHEDLEERSAREGYGCKRCEATTSESWWRGSGDIYCFVCKKSMRGLAKFTKLAHRG